MICISQNTCFFLEITEFLFIPEGDSFIVNYQLSIVNSAISFFIGTTPIHLPHTAAPTGGGSSCIEKKGRFQEFGRKHAELFLNRPVGTQSLSTVNCQLSIVNFPAPRLPAGCRPLPGFRRGRR